jgi:anaerobic selenocysteine-containing dehydrogenase
VACFLWTGLEQHTNATQTNRAIALLYALTGSFDVPGGNVIFPVVPTTDVANEIPLPPGQASKTLGRAERPLSQSRAELITSDDLYRAILDREPYPVTAMVGFGSNLLLGHPDVRRGREALASLDFFVHADLFMTPTAELADVVLPVASGFEREGLQIGFPVSGDAQTLVQLRKQLVEPLGRSRADTEIVFDLACRLGLGDKFWGGDIDAGYRHQLAPSGIALEALRANPGGVRVSLETRLRKYATEKDGVPAGFSTPTRKVEVYSERLLEHGYRPLPDYDEPLVGPVSRPELAERFPLVLTCAKQPQFIHSQHRALPSLRRRVPDPEIELHPAAAAERGIQTGDWVVVTTPDGSNRVRARLNESLDPRVVSGQHGWWQAAPEIGAPGYDPFGPTGANFNLLIGGAHRDPISGTAPLRSYLCQISRIDQREPATV